VADESSLSTENIEVAIIYAAVMITDRFSWNTPKERAEGCAEAYKIIRQAYQDART